MLRRIISRFGSWLIRVSGSSENEPALPSAADYQRDTAYLVVQFTTDSPVPIVQGVGIYSAPAEQLTGINKQVSATIMMMAGKNYHEASRDLEKWVFEDPRLAWARPWLEKEDGKFTQLYEMQIFVQRCVDIMETIKLVEE